MWHPISLNASFIGKAWAEKMVRFRVIDILQFCQQTHAKWTHRCEFFNRRVTQKWVRCFSVEKLVLRIVFCTVSCFYICHILHRQVLLAVVKGGRNELVRFFLAKGWQNTRNNCVAFARLLIIISFAFMFTTYVVEVFASVR